MGEQILIERRNPSRNSICLPQPAQACLYYILIKTLYLVPRTGEVELSIRNSEFFVIVLSLYMGYAACIQLLFLPLTTHNDVDINKNKTIYEQSIYQYIFLREAVTDHVKYVLI